MPNSDYNLKTILKEIKLSENGQVVDAMEKMGLRYKENFGVSIANLKKIAKRYKPNHKFAEILRKKEIRETRILAEMIEDSDLISEQKADEIVSKINTNELAEQTCINLFENLKFADKKAEEWITSDREYTIVCGFILFSRLALINMKKQDDFFKKPITLSEKLSENSSIFVRKSIARALRQIALRNINLKKQVLDVTNKIKEKKSSYSKLVIEEVVPLIDY